MSSCEEINTAIELNLRGAVDDFADLLDELIVARDRALSKAREVFELSEAWLPPRFHGVVAVEAQSLHDACWGTDDYCMAPVSPEDLKSEAADFILLVDLAAGGDGGGELIVLEGGVAGA
jgi:hypothetical protein